ncbi:MAG: CpaD family pilus assembly protein [Xanthobacteraceae bacterium]
MHSIPTMEAGRRAVAGLAVRAAIAAGCALFLCGCNTDQRVAGPPDPPTDYRLRHPITMQESDHSIELFIGSNRGELTPTQRAQVLSFGLGWKREATGGIVIARPVGSSNEQASADAMREIGSILAASGMPPQSIMMRTYPAQSSVATVRISYPKITAQAGPCGIWPEDIGPSMTRSHDENRPYWNFGCATQRNLAAMVAEPADLVQPRAETAAYTMRRTTVIEKYRVGNDASTASSSGAQAAKLTDVGK